MLGRNTSEESDIENNEKSAVKQMTEWLSSQDDNGVSNLEKTARITGFV